MSRSRFSSGPRDRGNERSNPTERVLGDGGTDDHEQDDDESPLEDVVAGITIGLILTVAFGLLALGVSWFWIVFPIGFGGLLPAVIGLTQLYERRRRDRTHSSAGNGADLEDDHTALETLRERYARGDLTDAQFERRLERLVATETLEDAERAVGDRSRDDHGTRDADRVDTELERS